MMSQAANDWVQASLTFSSGIVQTDLTAQLNPQIETERPADQESRGVYVSRPYELFEQDYIRFSFEARKRNLEKERTAKQAELETLGGRATKRRLELLLRLRAITHTLEKIERDGLTPEKESWCRREYMLLVKDAIRRGEPVPSEIIAQRVEFQRAFTGRQRYEKGRHTSFANSSVAVDTRFLATCGFKAKLQNGKPMRGETMDELAQGLDEIEAVIGRLGNLLRATNLTIAHTLGKHPFMRGDAGGLYVPSERTVTVGTMTHSGRLIRSLAHELLGHWLDYEAGKAFGVTTRVRKGKRLVDASALSEYSVRYGLRGADTLLRQDGALIAQASSLVRDRVLAQKVTRKKVPNDVELGEEDIEIYKFVLGHSDYWLAPREILARLCEQFCAKRFAAPQIAFEPFAWYTQRAAYWSAEDFATLELLIEQALRWRVEILAAHVDAKNDVT